MKKLMLGAAVSAALFGGAAHATLPAGFTPANTVEVYLSGASAPRVFIETLIRNTTNYCQGALVGGVNNGVFTYQDTSSNNQNAYACVMSPALKADVDAARGDAVKTRVVFYKRSAGGSDFGVTPVYNQTPIAFMDADNAGCPAPIGGGIATCAATLNRISDFGVSDVDPQQFGLTDAQVNNPATGLAVVPAFAQPFGIPVSLNAYKALQAVLFPASNKCNPQNVAYNSFAAAGHATGSKAKIKNGESGACVPSLSRDQVTSILTGRITSWDQVYTGTKGAAGTPLTSNPAVLAAAAAGALDLPANPAMHVCGRVNTSGTYKQMTIKFLNNPCSSSATAPWPDTGAGGNGALFPAEAFGTQQIHQLSSAGNVNECLDELDKGVNTTGTTFNNVYTNPRWAIGYQGTDNNANLAFNYRYVAINGVAPSVQNIVAGTYLDWVESTYQFSRLADFTSTADVKGVKAAADFFIGESDRPAVIGTVNASGQGCPAGIGAAAPGYTGISRHCAGDYGFLATPAIPGNNAAPAGNVALFGTAPINSLSHDTTVAGTSINNCRVPALYNPGTPSAPKGMQYRINMLNKTF